MNSSRAYTARREASRPGTEHDTEEAERGPQEVDAAPSETPELLETTETSDTDQRNIHEGSIGPVSQQSSSGEDEYGTQSWIALVQ